jgi:glycosyltransferase involved in cell wall biosynthesis
MRILHVTPYYPPDRVGGVGEVVAHIHEGLRARGHKSVVVTSGWIHGDSHVRRLGRSLGTFSLRSLAALPLLRSADIAHFHHGEAVALIAASRLVGRPASLLTLHVDNRRVGAAYRPITVQGFRVSDGVSGFLQLVAKAPAKKVLDVVAMRMTDSVSFVSRATANEVLGEIGGGSATVVPNAVPVPPPSRYLGGDGADVLFVGTPNHRKRVGLLPFLLRRIRDSVPHARLRIVGFDRRARPDVHARFCEFGLEREVVYEGSVPSRDIAAFYNSSSVMLVPSAYEGMPMVILEALRSGLPVVASDVGGVSEIRAQRWLQLVPVDDVEALAEATVSVIEERTASMAGDSGTHDAVLSDLHSVDTQIDHYLKVYRQVMASGPR